MMTAAIVARKRSTEGLGRNDRSRFKYEEEEEEVDVVLIYNDHVWVCYRK